MQREILKVNDIDKAIQAVGLEYYVDRLLQDERGDYFWVECEKINPEERAKYSKTAEYSSKDRRDPSIEFQITFRYDIVKIPKELAWFCIDALKLQSQVLGIGSSEYDGPHGGKITYVDEDHKEVPEYLVRVEEL